MPCVLGCVPDVRATRARRQSLCTGRTSDVRSVKGEGKQRLRAGERADRDFTIRMPGGIAQSDIRGTIV